MPTLKSATTMNISMPALLRSLGLVLLLFALLPACKQDTSPTEDAYYAVRVRIASEPNKLSPLLTFDSYSRMVNEQLFQYLLQFDYETLEMQPHLAQSRPQIEEITEGPYTGGVAYTFEIRPEAHWDDGQPITAEDVVFSLKALFHPGISPAAIRSYFDSFKQVEIDPENPRRFTVYSNRKYILGEAAIGGIAVYPAHIYDTAGVMAAIELQQMTDESAMSQLMDSNADLVSFAEDFTSTSRTHDPAAISGSGPYRVAEWQTGQQVRLVRKTDWWADDAKRGNNTLIAYPDELIFKVISDQTTAVQAMRAEEVDVVSQIDSRDFALLQEDTAFTKNYDLYTPLAFQIYYIGFNNRIAKLSDPKVRKALAHALNTDQVIETLYANLAQRLVSPFHPEQPYYHHDLPMMKYDLEKATTLLREAGWEDTNGNGIVDKVIDGQRTELELSFLSSSNSRFSQDLALLYKEALERIGVQLNIDVKEFGAVRDDFRRLDFEIFAGAWAQEPIPDDPKQIWHSENAAPGGSNRMGFGSPETDRLIEEIRTTLDTELRNQLYLQLQEIIYEEQPGIFMFAPKERIAIHKRFDAKPTSIRPGFFANTFRLKEGAN